MPHVCLVCGYPHLKSAPRSPSGGGSYEICPSCGYQYGVDDDDRGISHESWLKTWVAAGAIWTSKGVKKPASWKYVPAAGAKSKATSKPKAPAKKAAKKASKKVTKKKEE